MNAVLCKSSNPPKYDVIEGFAGLSNLTKAFRTLNYQTLRLDKKYNPQIDFSTPVGLRIFLIALRQLKPGGLNWMGLECKTWIWIARNTFKRSSSSPLGNEDLEPVRAANKVLVNAVVTGLVVYFSEREFIVEQPVSSIMTSVPHFICLLSVTGSNTTCLDHGQYDDQDAPNIVRRIRCRFCESIGCELRMKKQIRCEFLRMQTGKSYFNYESFPQADA